MRGSKAIRRVMSPHLLWSPGQRQAGRPLRFTCLFQAPVVLGFQGISDFNVLPRLPPNQALWHFHRIVELESWWESERLSSPTPSSKQGLIHHRYS